MNYQNQPAAGAWPQEIDDSGRRPVRVKFQDQETTVSGETRARVEFQRYETLWFNTGTLCNIACQGCYIGSSPRNDALVYLSVADVRRFLDEADRLSERPGLVGFTGGEPFMNPDIISILSDTLGRGYRVLVLTNAMKPMQHHKAHILALAQAYPGKFGVRVSLDHYSAGEHERIRGPRTWEPALKGLQWLSQNNFDIAVACRTPSLETEAVVREGFAQLFAKYQLAVDANDPQRLVLFPEMAENADVPEVTERCWSILGQNPSDMMCASSRMVVRRKDSDHAEVVSCTLLPHAPGFTMGRTLSAAMRHVALNHPHCARFCVLGGATCSAGAA